LTISVRVNHAQRENNRSSFGTFFVPNLMSKLTNRRGPDGRNSRAGLCRPLIYTSSQFRPGDSKAARGIAATRGDGHVYVQSYLTNAPERERERERGGDRVTPVYQMTQGPSFNFYVARLRLDG